MLWVHVDLGMRSSLARPEVEQFTGREMRTLWSTLCSRGLAKAMAARTKVAMGVKCMMNDLFWERTWICFCVVMRCWMCEEKVQCWRLLPLYIPGCSWGRAVMPCELWSILGLVWGLIGVWSQCLPEDCCQQLISFGASGVDSASWPSDTDDPDPSRHSIVVLQIWSGSSWHIDESWGFNTSDVSQLGLGGEQHNLILDPWSGQWDVSPRTLRKEDGSIPTSFAPWILRTHMILHQSIEIIATSRQRRRKFVMMLYRSSPSSYTARPSGTNTYTMASSMRYCKRSGFDTPLRPQ